MAVNIKRPNGTEDVLPKDVYKWHTVEKVAREIAESFGFSEIRVPTFENTDLFLRSVGETTDVVQKEMYTVKAKETEFTLRPEGTAGTIRAMLQNGLLNDALPQRAYYIISCFRHERPQAGRLREFHQFGLEMAGSASPAADAEVISLAKTLLDRLGLRNIELYINSIGCPKCRGKYQEALKAHFGARKDELCDSCRERLVKNPMRLLDCKSPICQSIGEGAPIITDYLCEECSEHFESLKKYLTGLNISFKVNPKIVRGLDYYTKTVFEFVTTEIGAQGTVCGGGRYDGLIEELGGQHTPSLGFAMGLERLLSVIEAQGIELPGDQKCDIYIGSIGDAASLVAAKLCTDLRSDGVSAQFDVAGRSVKAQMKYADKLGARFTCVIGDDDIAKGEVLVKNMENGEKTAFSIENFSDEFSSALVQAAANAFADSINDGDLNAADISNLFGGLRQWRELTLRTSKIISANPCSFRASSRTCATASIWLLSCSRISPEKSR